MPSRSDWAELAKQTFHAVDREDVADLYQVEWRQAADALIAEHLDAIQAERKAWKRWIRKANAVLYGLSRRLSPTRRILLAAALALGMLGGIEFRSESEGRTKLVHIDMHFISVGILTLLLCMELVDKVQFKDELLLARDLQADLLPKVLPDVEGYEIGAHNRIANTVGGDLYDFEVLEDGRLVVLFGDASGHGMTAGLVMAVSHAAFLTQIDIDPSPGAILTTLNRILCRTGACRTAGPRQFFAGIALTLERDGRFSAMVAGHPPILKLDAQGRVVERFGRGSYPVGVKAGVTWPLLTGTLAPGETLLFHSDGLPDCPNIHGEEFGDERILRVIERRVGASASELVGALSSSLSEFLGRRPPEDDVSIAAIRRRTLL
ncbi:MAG: SpoIIE family protein phosphatase [Thermoanaerobaculia bacterium]